MKYTQPIWGRKFWATGKPMNISTSNFPPHFDSHLHFFLNNSDQIISDQTFKQKLSNPYLIEHLIFFLMWCKKNAWALGFRWTFTNVYFWMRSLHSNSRLKWYWKMIFICIGKVVQFKNVKSGMIQMSTSAFGRGGWPPAAARWWSGPGEATNYYHGIILINIKYMTGQCHCWLSFRFTKSLAKCWVPP